MLFADRDIAIGAMIGGVRPIWFVYVLPSSISRHTADFTFSVRFILELTSSGIAKLGDYMPRRSRVDTHSGIDLGIAILEHADPRGSYDRLNTATVAHDAQS